MSRRWAGAPELVLVLSALALGGCVEVLDLGRFTIGDDDAGRDAGGRDAGDGMADAGRDACVPATYYVDADGDGHGDPAAAVALCSPTAGYVTVAGDCDDGDETIAPGATETCDDVDQDCDGAVDEGLIGPLGTWIEVAPEVGVQGGAMVLAHRDGITVAWRAETEDIWWASFFDRNATPIESNVYVRGNGTTARAMERFRRDGVGRVVLLTVEHGQMISRLCSSSGVCATPREIFSGDTTSFEDLRLQQLGDRMITRWTSSDGLQMLSFDPETGDSSNVLVIQGVEGTTTSEFTGLATVDGPEPYSLIGGYSAVLDGATIVSVEAFLVRVRGDAELAFEPSIDRLPWDIGERCARLGRDSCVPLYVSPMGRVSIDGERLPIFEILYGYDTGTPDHAYCMIDALPTAEGRPVLGECRDWRDVRAVAIRPGSVIAVTETSVDYSLRDVPLSPAASGSEPIVIPEVARATGRIDGVSMYRAFGAIAARTGRLGGNDVSLLRLGCEP